MRRSSRRCSARGAGWRSAAASTRTTATSIPTRWPPPPSTRRCATSSPSAPIRRASPCSTTSAGATPIGPKCSARWCGPPRRAATWPSPTACRSSAARTASTTNSTPATGTSSFRRRCSSARWASVPDVRRCVTMDLKEPGNLLYLVGVTKPELGGSHYHLVTGQTVVSRRGWILSWPRDCSILCTRRFEQGLVRSCHDLSEGGLAVAAAEMAFAGGVGADLTAAPEADDVWLFSESPTRWLVEIEAGQGGRIRELFRGAAVSSGRRDGGGAAVADRRGGRRVGRVGGACGIEGGVAIAGRMSFYSQMYRSSYSTWCFRSSAKNSSWNDIVR